MSIPEGATRGTVLVSSEEGGEVIMTTLIIRITIMATQVTGTAVAPTITKAKGGRRVAEWCFTIDRNVGIQMIKQVVYSV